MYVVVVTTADGEVSSVAGTFSSEVIADGWSADLTLATEGDLSGIALELEEPETVMAAACGEEAES